MVNFYDQNNIWIYIFDIIRIWEKKEKNYFWIKDVICIKMFLYA